MDGPKVVQQHAIIVALSTSMIEAKTPRQGTAEKPTEEPDRTIAALLDLGVADSAQLDYVRDLLGLPQKHNQPPTRRAATHLKAMGFAALLLTRENYKIKVALIRTLRDALDVLKLTAKYVQKLGGEIVGERERGFSLSNYSSMDVCAVADTLRRGFSFDCLFAGETLFYYRDFVWKVYLPMRCSGRPFLLLLDELNPLPRVVPLAKVEDMTSDDARKEIVSLVGEKTNLK